LEKGQGENRNEQHEIAAVSAFEMKQFERVAE